MTWETEDKERMRIIIMEIANAMDTPLQAY
jgi:hypothetical protein